jgi:hypothetical protein
MSFRWQTLQHELNDITRNGQSSTRFSEGRARLRSRITKLHGELSKPTSNGFELCEQWVFTNAQSKQVCNVVRPIEFDLVKGEVGFQGLFRGLLAVKTGFGDQRQFRLCQFGHAQIGVRPFKPLPDDLQIWRHKSAFPFAWPRKGAKTSQAPIWRNPQREQSATPQVPATLQGQDMPVVPVQNCLEHHLRQQPLNRHRCACGLSP